jgi:translation initiation factor 2 alpha subunit (eIF-2alpha)
MKELNETEQRERDELAQKLHDHFEDFLAAVEEFNEAMNEAYVEVNNAAVEWDTAAKMATEWANIHEPTVAYEFKLECPEPQGLRFKISENFTDDGDEDEDGED